VGGVRRHEIVWQLVRSCAGLGAVFKEASMRKLDRRPGGTIGVWTVVQIVGILVWISGFVIAFYYLNWIKASASVKQNGQIAAMVLTGIAYLVIIYSMVKHSPDREV
jgi:membrane protein YdbS with pleckstrin-like domain